VNTQDTRIIRTLAILRSGNPPIEENTSMNAMGMALITESCKNWLVRQKATVAVDGHLAICRYCFLPVGRIPGIESAVRVLA
jgi:hypothetical protein